MDLANEGEFLCGLAHSPRFIDETIAQAQAAAGRATTILSKAFLEIPGQVARVNPEDCVACATCVKVCPYGAPMINSLNKAEIQGAKCMGCGSMEKLGLEFECEVESEGMRLVRYAIGRARYAAWWSAARGIG